MANEKSKKIKGRYYGLPTTVALAVVLVLLLAILWALFISGPARIHDEQLANAYEKIEEKVPGIQGLEKNIFDYVTYQGYTEDTLYWFDQKFDEITTRDIATLDYEKARKIAQEQYGMEPETVQLTFGYNSPCYEIIDSKKMLLLDYDTFSRVYER
ncbi:hypothetical protein C815_00434 [Firmicutes bacterium M10-2]|nr:hypothetical protein C815_00434 [Firmicutes bacterium M10-2]